MKHYKPGQYVSVNGIIYRATARTIGCTGCVFRNDLILCPCMRDKRSKTEPLLNCAYDNIVLKAIPSNQLA